MNKEEPPGDNFASGAVWHTTIFKVSAFNFFFSQTYWLPDNLVEDPKLNPNNHYI